MVTYDICVKTLLVIVTYNYNELALKCLVVSEVVSSMFHTPLWHHIIITQIKRKITSVSNPLYVVSNIYDYTDKYHVAHDETSWYILIRI